MSKEQTKDLLKFLKPFSTDIVETVLWLRDFVWDLYPQTNELIYDNYNAVAFGWSPTDKVGHTFCSIAIGRTSKNIHFGFYWGSELSDPDKILLGQGNQYRYILVNDKDKFPKPYIKATDSAWACRANAGSPRPTGRRAHSTQSARQSSSDRAARQVKSRRGTPGF